MKDFFKLRESLQTNEMYADYKSSPGYNDNDHKQFSHHKGDDKRSVQYRKAEHEVSHKHGADAHAIGHHKGDTAVEHEKSHRDFSGSSSSDHSSQAVVHHDGTHTNISLDKLNNCLTKDLWWSSKFCKKNGLIDEII